ncbi:MAG: nucleotidyltransferase domain-containing protein [Candidatus Aenigmatarchaeota archaeon]
MELKELEKELEELEIKTEEQKNQLREKILPKVISFSKRILSEYGNLIKSISIFGSAAKGKMKPTSDIDVWIIVDDTSLKTSKDIESVLTNIRIRGEEFELHVQTTKITDFWNLISKGSPELVNFLRYSLIIYDSGFLKPTQRMLNFGLIMPSEEAIEVKKRSSIIRFEKIKDDLKSLIFELRYCVIDIIQAVIMKKYQYIPDPKTIPQYLEKLIEEKIISKEYLEKYNEIDSLWKKIEHKEIKEVDGSYLDKAIKITNDFIETFSKLC